MKLLGIDYGKKKIGLAIADSQLKIVSPYDLIRYKEEKEVIDKIDEVCKKEDVDKIVIGIPLSSEGEENEFGLVIRGFGKKLSEATNLEVDFQSEFLTSHEARYRQEIDKDYLKNSVETKVKIDSFAAAIILENYLLE